MQPFSRCIFNGCSSSTKAVVSRIWVGDDDVRRKKAVEFVTEGLESDALKPVIERIVAFDDIREAHRLLRLNCR